MKIASDAGNSELEIVRNDDADPYSGCRISLKIKTSAGEYKGANRCVHFSAFDRFESRLAELIQSRNGAVHLDMTEGCKLEFFRWNAKGDVGIKVTIAQNSVEYDPVCATPVSVTGTFKIASEFLNSIEGDFKKIQKTNQAGTDNPGASPLQV